MQIKKLSEEKTVEALKNADVVSFDTEYDGGTPPAFASWYGFSLACLDPEDPEVVIAKYWSFRGFEKVDHKYAINKVLKPIINDPSKTIVVHSASAELGILKARKIPFPPHISDTMLKSFLWDENKLKGLKEQAKLRLGVKKALTFKQTETELSKFDKKAKDVIKKMLKAAWEYYKETRKNSDEETPDNTEIMDDWPSWKRVAHRLSPKMKKADVLSYIKERFEQKIINFYNRKKDKMFSDYATDDAVYTILLHHLFTKLFAEFKEATGCDLEQIHDELELPMMYIVTEMQHYGMQVDLEAVKRIHKVLSTMKAKLDKQFVRWFGPEFNPQSAQQVTKLFWETLGLTPPVWLKVSEKTGEYGCPGNVLEWLADKKGIKQAKALKRYRNISKMLGTYANAILNQERNGRIYTSFNPVGADTGRWTSGGGKGKNKKISAQTIPNAFALPHTWAPKIWTPEDGLPEEWAYGGLDKKSNRHKWRPESFRKAFVATPGYSIISYDLSQIELRLMAHFCLQRNMNVTLADSSTMEIGTLVNNSARVDVLSYDFSGKQTVKAPVVNHWRNNKKVKESVYRAGTEDWLILRHEGAPNRKLVLTPNHGVYDVEGKEKPMSEFKVGDSLVFLTPKPIGNSKQILLASLLGDGNFKRSKSKSGIGTHWSMDFYQCEKQAEYFDWKVEHLQPFITRKDKEGDLNKAHVRASHHINRLHSLLVKGGVKKPTVEGINELNTLGLAVWYMDDGSLDHDDRCSSEVGWSCSISNTKANEATVLSLNKKFGLDFRLWSRGYGLCGERAHVFFDLIAPFIHPSMQYKLPKKYRGKWVAPKIEYEEVSPCKIIEIRKPKVGEVLFRKKLKQPSFDIEVQDTHNYFAQGILVSNSKDKALLEAYRRWDCADCGATGHTEVVLHECPKCGAKPGKRDKLDPKQPAIKGFCLGMDIHALTCVLTPLFKTYGMERGRALAKPVNFGLLYGKHHKSLAQELDVSEEEGKVIYDGYFKAYPGVKRYHDWVRYRIQREGWFEYLSGRRRRYFEEVNKFRSGKITQYQFEQVIRSAYNCIIQGSAGDIMKLGMRDLQREKEENPDTIGRARYLLQVHDETMLEAPDEVAQLVGDRLKFNLENCCKIRVPILSEGTVGAKSWEEAH